MVTAVAGGGKSPLVAAKRTERRGAEGKFQPRPSLKRRL